MKSDRYIFAIHVHIQVKLNLSVKIYLSCLFSEKILNFLAQNNFQPQFLPFISFFYFSFNRQFSSLYVHTLKQIRIETTTTTKKKNMCLLTIVLIDIMLSINI